MHCEVEFDLLCKWELMQPRYRVFVDGELHTERQYRWNNQELYVCEHMDLDLEPGEHTYEIQTVDTAGEFTVFEARVNNLPIVGGLKGTFTV